MVVALNSGSYGTAGAADVKNCVATVRFDATELSTTALRNFYAAGLKVILLFAGPYTTKWRQRHQRRFWVTNALNYYKGQLHARQHALRGSAERAGWDLVLGSECNQYHQRHRLPESIAADACRLPTGLW
jgi:hypothetical protein